MCVSLTASRAFATHGCLMPVSYWKKFLTHWQSLKYCLRIYNTKHLAVDGMAVVWNMAVVTHHPYPRGIYITSYSRVSVNENKIRNQNNIKLSLSIHLFFVFLVLYVELSMVNSDMQRRGKREKLETEIDISQIVLYIHHMLQIGMIHTHTHT